jgi:citrate lyase beta subunit
LAKADVLILDLEDSVVAAQKQIARERVEAHLNGGLPPRRIRPLRDFDGLLGLAC